MDRIRSDDDDLLLSKIYWNVYFLASISTSSPQSDTSKLSNKLILLIFQYGSDINSKDVGHFDWSGHSGKTPCVYGMCRLSNYVISNGSFDNTLTSVVE
jgi:hypothetical protein